MTTPDSHVSTVTSTAWIAPDENVNDQAPRLIVVISGVSEPAALARRILGLTSNKAQPVLLVGVASSSQAEAELRRNLISVEGFIAAQGNHVELRTDSNRQWAEHLASECGVHDQVACFDELDPKSIRRQPLSDILARLVRLPIRDLTDLERPVVQRSSVVPRLGAWLGSIAIIAGFLALQTKIVLEVQDWTQSVMLLLTLVPEVGLIWFWNSIWG